MRQIRITGREYDLRIARQVEPPGLVAVIGDRHPPQLRIVFRRDDNFSSRFDAAVHPSEYRTVRGEAHFVFIRLTQARLVCRGPVLA